MERVTTTSPPLRDWPDLESAPTARVRAAVARAVLRRVTGKADVDLVLPNGHRLDRGGRLTMIVTSPQCFHRLGADVRVGFGEAYMAGEWQTGDDTDLGDLLAALAPHAGDGIPGLLTWVRRLAESRHPHHEANTTSGSRANIRHHYDLSNELFERFLDETMTYSSAWFAGDADPDRADLATAQRRKIDRLLDEAQVGAGTSVLEIGSGWGQLALQAAARGARVHTITLSAEQMALAQRRFDAAGVSDQVTIELRDYRDVEGTYDAVVSVEMIEAVGEEFLPAYFGAIAGALRPGGRFALQAITNRHERMLTTKDAYSWVNKYIFPGGFLPSVRLIDELTAAAGLAPAGERLSLQDDYPPTLRHWRRRFLDADVSDLGFDDTFRRLWELYLAYSEAGFRSRQIEDWQLTYERR